MANQTLKIIINRMLLLFSILYITTILNIVLCIEGNINYTFSIYSTLYFGMNYL